MSPSRRRRTAAGLVEDLGVLPVGPEAGLGQQLELGAGDDAGEAFAGIGTIAR